MCERTGCSKLCLTPDDRDGSPTHKRTAQEIETLVELLANNKIFSQLGVDRNHAHQICQDAALMWADHPHLPEISDQSIYLVLEGQAFEYMNKNSVPLKIKIHEQNDYFMVRKLACNDYFVEYTPPQKYVNQLPQRKYQLMVDENTLLAKVAGRTFARIVSPAVEARYRKILSFGRQVRILSTLPSIIIYELSKYMTERVYSKGSNIILRNDTNAEIFFIKSGEVEYQYTPKDTIKPSFTRNYCLISKKSAGPRTLRQFDTFGVNSLTDSADHSACAQTDCEVYCIEKRLFATVLSSFRDVSERGACKVWTSVNLNEQIIGHAYQNSDSVALSKKVDAIRSSQRKARDIKLRFMQSVRRSRAQLIEDVDEKLTNQVKSASSQNFAKARLTSNKFYQTHQPMCQSKSTSKPRLSEVVMSAYEGDEDEDNLAKTARTTANGRFSTLCSMRVKRKSDEVQHGGKQESDVIRVYLEKKFKKEVTQKADLILQRNKNSQAYGQVKRIYSLKKMRSKTTEPSKRKELDEELYSRMNQVAQNPLLSLIEKQRKKQQIQFHKTQLSRAKQERKKETQAKPAQPLILINSRFDWS